MYFVDQGKKWYSKQNVLEFNKDTSIKLESDRISNMKRPWSDDVLMVEKMKV